MSSCHKDNYMLHCLDVASVTFNLNNFYQFRVVDFSFNL